MCRRRRSALEPSAACGDEQQVVSTVDQEEREVARFEAPNGGLVHGSTTVLEQQRQQLQQLQQLLLLKKKRKIEEFIVTLRHPQPIKPGSLTSQQLLIFLYIIVLRFAESRLNPQ